MRKIAADNNYRIFKRANDAQARVDDAFDLIGKVLNHPKIKAISKSNTTEDIELHLKLAQIFGHLNTLHHNGVVEKPRPIIYQ